MNIFATDPDPMKCAIWLDDKRISKMLTESAQMLANCFVPEVLEEAPLTAKGTVRLHSHYNHPCSRWVRETQGNMYWLLLHAQGIRLERYSRKMNPHSCEPFICWVEKNMDQFANLRDYTDQITPFAVAIPQDARCRTSSFFKMANTIGQYRMYYKHDKTNAIWNRDPTSRPKFLDLLDHEIASQHPIQIVVPS